MKAAGRVSRGGEAGVTGKAQRRNRNDSCLGRGLASYTQAAHRIKG